LPRATKTTKTVARKATRKNRTTSGALRRRRTRAPRPLVRPARRAAPAAGVPTLNDLRQSNDTALATLDESLLRLRQLRIGTTPSQRAKFDAAISEVLVERNLLATIQIHLDAAAVVVSPLSAAQTQELHQLEDRLDAAIRNNAIVTADLQLLISFLRDAQRIGDIIQENT
jgi:hypothetical protein